MPGALCVLNTSTAIGNVLEDYFRVPSAERFALHKLVVSQLRPARDAKAGRDLSQAAILLAVLADAKKYPTIAASNAQLPEESPIVAHHGYAVMGVAGSTVLLRNPWGGTDADKKLPLKDFKMAF